MRGHDAGGIEEGSAVLHEDALEAVGVVGGPDFVEILQRAIVDAAAAGGAALDQHGRILGADALHHLVEALHIFNIEAVLLGAEIGAAEGLDGTVAVPFDVVDGGGELHHAVEDAEDEVLDGRVGEVEHPLRALGIDFPARALDDPVGMVLGEFGLGIDHLRLDPDAELQAFGMGISGDVIDALGELADIDLPVAKGGVVAVAGVFVAEPAVVEHEHLEAHRGGVVNHAQERLCREGEIGAFPAVQEDGVDLPAAVDAVVARPAVEIAGSLPRAAAGPGPDHVGGAEGRAGLQRIFGSEGGDAAEHGQAVLGVALEAQAPVARPGEGAGDDLAVIFPQLVRVEGQEEGGIAELRVLDAAMVLQDLRVVGEEFAFHLHFLGPGTVDVGQQIALGRDGQGAGSIAQQRQGLLPAIDDLGVRQDDVFFRVSLIDEVDQQGSDVIPEMDGRRGHAVRGRDFAACIIQFGVVRPVGIADVQGRLAEEAAARRGIGRCSVSVAPVIGRDGREFRFVYFRSVVQLHHGAVIPDRKNQGGVIRFDGDDLRLHQGDNGRCRHLFLRFLGDSGQRE